MFAIALAGAMCVVSPAFAEPTAGFPSEDEPPPAPVEPPPAPAPPPVAPVAPPMPAAGPAAPPAADPGTPFVDPYPHGAAPVESAPLVDPYGSGLPPGPIAVDPGAPLVLPYRSGHPVPAGYHVESRPASGLIVSGTLTLVAGYAAALGFGLSEGFENGNGWVVVPVVGPWGAIGARKFKCDAQTVDEARECFDGAYSEATSIAILAVDGMIQATGLVILFAGLASGRDELVRDDASTLELSARRRPGGFDLGLSGRF